jgi:hypothetical protein
VIEGLPEQTCSFCKSSEHSLCGYCSRCNQHSAEIVEWCQSCEGTGVILMEHGEQSTTAIACEDCEGTGIGDALTPCCSVKVREYDYDPND